MLGEKELEYYLKEDEVKEKKEKKEVDINSIFETVNENLAKLVEAMAELSNILTAPKEEEVKEEEVKEIETEEEKEV